MIRALDNIRANGERYKAGDVISGLDKEEEARLLAIRPKIASPVDEDEILEEEETEEEETEEETTDEEVTDEKSSETAKPTAKPRGGSKK